jgi:hypothetical protein
VPWVDCPLDEAMLIDEWRNMSPKKKKRIRLLTVKYVNSPFLGSFYLNSLFLVFTWPFNSSQITIASKLPFNESFSVVG